jgi:CxxC-x17-CxxC domain-containing protein
MNYTDRSLTCVQCGTEFVFSADDQSFHASRGYQDPKRCPRCRAERRAMSNNGYDQPSYVERPRRELHTATCSQCGGEARVPFIPRNDRPVYCSDCYRPAARW